METNLMDSAIPSMFTQEMNAQNFDWDYKDTEILYNVLFSTILDALNSTKATNMKKKGVKICDEKSGDFILGAISTFIPSEEDPEQGTWNVEFSVNEEDFKEVTCLDSNDHQFQRIFTVIALRGFNMCVEAEPYVGAMSAVACETLLHWLDENAVKKDVVSLIIPKVIKASVEVDDSKNDGIKVITIEPLEELTHSIKEE